MALLSRSQFASAAHVSKPAITKAVKVGRLVLTTDDKLDTYNPINSAYLASRVAADAVSPPPAKPATAPAPSPPPAPSLLAAAAQVKISKSDTVSPLPKPKKPPHEYDDIAGMAVESMNLDTTKKKVQIELYRAQTRNHDMTLAIKKKELLPKDLERRKWSSFDAALKTHFLDMPRRISAQLAALAASGGRPAVEKALEEEISSSLARVVQAAKEQDLI